MLYALGVSDRIAGISGFTVYPPEARKQKPKISGFSTGKLEKILAVSPDLVIAFSGLQTEICADLIKAGISVLHFNQRSVEGILAMVETLGRVVGEEQKALALVTELEALIVTAKAQASARRLRPRVYFEEWHDPLISGIGWASELIEIAGGVNIFAELAAHQASRDRTIADPMEVVRRAPDIMIASWCGKPFAPEQVLVRPEWQSMPAIAHGQMHEIRSADILAPGPAAIRYGLSQLTTIFDAWAARQ